MYGTIIVIETVVPILLQRDVSTVFRSSYTAQQTAHTYAYHPQRQAEGPGHIYAPAIGGGYDGTI